MIPFYAILIDVAFFAWLARDVPGPLAVCAVGLGLIATWTAVWLGKPLWSDWPLDASDIGMLTALVLMAIARIAE